MFSDKVWAMIHNRFKDSPDKRKWTDDMSAADWWIANDMGDPYAENVEIISPYQMPSGLMGFFERLHHAYNSTHGFWDNKYGMDDKEWYEEWILPFDDPLERNRDKAWIGAYVNNPRDYFQDMRYYFENEAPSEIFQHENFNKVEETFSWRPTKPKATFYGAINKKVVG